RKILLVGSTIASSAFVTKLMMSTVPGFTGIGAWARICNNIFIGGNPESSLPNAWPGLAEASRHRGRRGYASGLRGTRNREAPPLQSGSEAISRSLAAPRNRRGRSTPLGGFARRVVVCHGHDIEVVGQHVPLDLVRQDLLLSDGGQKGVRILVL